MIESEQGGEGLVHCYYAEKPMRRSSPAPQPPPSQELVWCLTHGPEPARVHLSEGHGDLVN